MNPHLRAGFAFESHGSRCGWWISGTIRKCRERLRLASAINFPAQAMNIFQKIAKLLYLKTFRVPKGLRLGIMSLQVFQEIKIPKMQLRVYILLLLLLCGLYSPAVIRYVRELPFGAANGTSWANAVGATNLQVAINLSALGDQVWVAAGTYRTTTTINRNIAFAMRNGVEIYGSFQATEVMLSERSLANGPTSILTGEIGVAGNADNSYHVISNPAGLNTTAILDGFVIRDAHDDRSPTFTIGLGGGIYNAGGVAPNFCSPQIRNCVITDNRAPFGAGIFNNGYNGGNASPILLNCVIVNNTATIGGGGLDNFGLAGTSSPTITNCLIANNVAFSRAGGMYCWGGNGGNANPTVLNCTFANNQALDIVVGPPGGGGGVVADIENAPSGSFSGNANPNFRNTIFWGNTTAGTGPQFFLVGSASFTATYSDIDLAGQNAPHVISGLGTGNVNADPMFVNAASGPGVDNFWMTADDGYGLQPGSPCINAGDNAGTTATDLKQEARITSVTVDMGAYETAAPVLATHDIGFWGEGNGVENVLHWAAPNHSQTLHYIIERGDDGFTFSELGTHGVGTQLGHRIDYTYIDPQPSRSMQYYRLQQIERDGNRSVSEVIRVENALALHYQAYPNPTTGSIAIKGYQGDGRIDVIGLQGNIVRSLAGGSPTLDISDLPDGIYCLLIKKDAYSECIRVVKL